MKKLLSLIMTLCMVLAMAVPAFAAEVNTSTEAASSTNSVIDRNVPVSDVLGGISTRSTSKPTAFWDLDDSTYHADLEEVGVAWLYTNYYFYSNDDGEIYVDYDVQSDGNPVIMRIGLYDLDDGSWTLWDTDYINVAGENGDDSMYFYNCDTSHRYAIAFTSVFDGFSRITLSGDAYISH